MREYLILDWETFSESPIKKTGAYEYALHQSTEILCAAFRRGTKQRLHTEKTHLWFPGEPNEAFPILLNSLLDPSVQLVAHNALFEILITKHVFGRRNMPSKPGLREIPLSRWHCTAAMSRSIGLPGKLEEVSKAWNLPHKKDMEGHKIMLRVSKPKKPSKKDPSTRLNAPELIRRLGAYCVSDLDAEVDLFLRLPEMHPKEREFWLLDQEINLRGFAVDRPLVNGALKLIAEETKRLDRRVKKLTNGELNSTRQVGAVLNYLKAHGVKLPNLQAATIKEYLAQ